MLDKFGVGNPHHPDHDENPLRYPGLLLVLGAYLYERYRERVEPVE